MKVFWALIGLLVLGTVGLFASGVLSGKSESAASSPPPSAQVSLPIAVVPPVKPQAPIAPAAQPPSDPPPLVAASIAALPAPEHQVATSAETPAAVPSAPSTPDTQVPVAVAPQPALEATKPSETVSVPAPAAEAPKPAAEPTDDSANPLIEMRKQVEAERAAEEAKKETQRAAAAKVAATPIANPTATGASADALFAGAKVEPKPDGSMLIDDKYIVKGKGTEEDPYKVTWDQLLSAQNEYAPKEGRKTIPPRIQALDDKWLDITGYVAFPLMTTEADELLSMMNQWDGCCIGVPPTPYDAVEVRLVNAVSGNARLTTYGSVKGKFKVDPHLVGGWLVGLYVMDQAKLTPVSYGGIAP